MTVKYRKTKAGGWVAYGNIAHVRLGTITVTKSDGTTKTETVVSLGAPFVAEGQNMIYGYLAGSRPATKSARQSTCRTGGNCSSFSNGRSCGAPDCDGW